MSDEAADQLSRIVTACFLGTWIVLGAGVFFLFFLGKDATWKRRWYPYYVVLIGLLFVIFSCLLTVLASGSLAALGITAVVVPMMLLISWLNIAMTKFCDRCGRMIVNSNWFNPIHFCPGCGAPIDPKPEPPDDPLD